MTTLNPYIKAKTLKKGDEPFQLNGVDIHGNEWNAVIRVEEHGKWSVIVAWGGPTIGDVYRNERRCFDDSADACDFVMQYQRNQTSK